MRTIFALAILIQTGASAWAADLAALKKLYFKHYYSKYEPIYCGKNIEGLIRAAIDQKIDLSNAYALRLETSSLGGNLSSFYGRESSRERSALGEFHYVLVADDHIFDFDLHRPMVLKIKEYFRLQFTPAYEPYYLSKITQEMLMDPRELLSSIQILRIELEVYFLPKPPRTWVKFLPEWLDVNSILALRRDEIEKNACEILGIGSG